MPNSSYTLSLLAKEDLLDTFEKGIKQWGINKATEYAQSIEDLLTVYSISTAFTILLYISLMIARIPCSPTLAMTINTPCC